MKLRTSISLAAAMLLTATAFAQSVPQFVAMNVDTPSSKVFEVSPEGYTASYFFYEYCTNGVCFNDGAHVIVHNGDGQKVMEIKFEKPVSNTSTPSKVFIKDGVVDQDNNLIVAGSFRSDVDFSSNSSTPTILNGNDYNSNNSSMFIAKYRISDGALLWVQAMHTTVANVNSFISNIHLTLDNDNNLYAFCNSVTGSFDIDPGPGVVAVNEQSFIAKYSGADGSYMNSKVLQGSFAYNYKALRYLNDKLYFLAINDSSATSARFYFEQMDPVSLQVIVSKQFGSFGLDNTSTGRDKQTDFKMDRDNNLWFMGSFINAINLPTTTGSFVQPVFAGYRGFFLAKMDANFDVTDVKMLQTTSNAYFCPVTFGFDSLNNILLMGSVQDSIDLDLGAGTSWVHNQSATPGWGGNNYMAYYDNGLQLQWVKSWGGTANMSMDYASIGRNRNIYITGSFKGTVNFDIDGGSHSFTSASTVTPFYDQYYSHYKWLTAPGSLGIHNNSLAAGPSFTIYPVPASDKLFIRTTSSSTNITATIADINGAVISSNRMNGSTMEISLEGMAPGQYLIRLTGKDFTEIRSFTKL
jgi:hypothetical protein